jgi:hypothetical protein
MRLALLAIPLLLAAACGGSSTPAPADPAGGEASAAPDDPAETAGPFDTGCADYAARCPGEESPDECVAEVSGDAWAGCQAMGQADAYVACVASDCLYTLECGMGVSQCWVACQSMACTPPDA